MKKCVVVSDSFKGTLSSLEICRIAGQAVPAIFPECEVVTIPVADGGEGTVDCFVEAIGAQKVTVKVTGPFGELISAAYCRKGEQAIIEMAAAAGLPLVKNHGDPTKTTTYGVGQLVRHAIENGCRSILLGLGGSATNDGGCGCAAALGAKFLNAAGSEFIPVGGTLDQIARIDLTECRVLLRNIQITAMCDITNPLYGLSGAAHVFAPQKGADKATVLRLDEQLRKLDTVTRRELGLDLSEYPGTGSAGGMGFGCMAFLSAELRAGIEAVLDLVDFEKKLEGADLVITGEGRIDSQSLGGKVVSGVAQRCGNVPLVAIVGSIDDSAQAAYDLGVTAMFSIDRAAVGYPQNAGRAAEDYRLTLEDILRLIRAAEHRNM